MHTWFINTKLYKDNLEDFVAGRGMTWKTKIRIMITVTLLMSIGFVLMGAKGIMVGCVVLSIVHTCVYKKKLNAKRWGLLLLIVISFMTGLMGMILEHIPLILILHRLISIAIVFFLAIHTYIFYKKSSLFGHDTKRITM